MQLVINTRGSYLKKKGNCFQIKNDDKVFEISEKKIESILITTSATLTTDAIKMAVDNNIDIVFLDYFGFPFGRVWHGKLGSTTLIRRRQLEIAEKLEGLKLAKKWAVKKMENQVNLLKELKKNRPKLKDELQEKINKIEEMKNNLKKLTGTINDKRNTMLGLEGMGSKIYFESINLIMPKKFKFNGRSRQPAKDEFNCLLNYGYGVLYSKVEKACIIAGLDPFVGFMHTDNYNKKSLVFDIIELYRTYIDETVIHLFSKRKVKEQYFDKIENGLTLNKDGKALLIEALNNNFEKTVKYRGRNVCVKNTIQLECHKIANSLIK